jgi:hypothetical protein
VKTNGTEITDHASMRSLRPHLLRSGVFFAVIGVFVTCWMVGLTFSTLAALAQVGVRTPDLGPSTDAFLTLVGVGGIIVFGLGWMISLLVSVREFVDEQETLVVGAAGRLDSVYEGLRSELDERCPPFTLQTGDLEGGHTLRLRGEDGWALVTVQPVGPDLDISWSMWRTRSTARLFSRVFADMVTGAQVHDPRLVHAGSTMAMRSLLIRTLGLIGDHPEA